MVPGERINPEKKNVSQVEAIQRTGTKATCLNVNSIKEFLRWQSHSAHRWHTHHCVQALGSLLFVLPHPRPLPHLPLLPFLGR